jgi:glycosyltransferase involved in cell wall biosynthesis
MYRTRRHLDELVARLDVACPPGTELVLVDDACPERSFEAARLLRDSGRFRVAVRIARHAVNAGQHAAILTGLLAARGDVVAVLDGDLQDAPEDVPVLVERLRGMAPDRGASGRVVCAARTGRYDTAGRQRSARCYRAAVRVLSRGRVPRGAGLFSALDRAAVEAVLRLHDPFAPLVPAAARAGCRLVAVPLDRHARAVGASSHGTRRRLRLAARGLVTLTPAYPLLRAHHVRRFASLGLVTVVEPPAPAARTAAVGARR